MKTLTYFDFQVHKISGHDPRNIFTFSEKINEVIVEVQIDHAPEAKRFITSIYINKKREEEGRNSSTLNHALAHANELYQKHYLLINLSTP